MGLQVPQGSFGRSLLWPPSPNCLGMGFHLLPSSSLTGVKITSFQPWKEQFLPLACFLLFLLFLQAGAGYHRPALGMSEELPSSKRPGPVSSQWYWKSSKQAPHIPPSPFPVPCHNEPSAGLHRCHFSGVPKCSGSDACKSITGALPCAGGKGLARQYF